MRLEKRRSPRLDFGITVIHDGKRGMTRDISANGTFIIMDEQPENTSLSPIGADLSFSLDFPNARRHIDVEGTVVHHSKDEGGMGIWFKRIDERNKEFIKMFILDYLK